MWGNWFIITLVTHSSGVSRGIHHKCKHSLNSTRLYVSGWVESSLSVLIWKVITRLGDVCILDCESISDYIDEIFMALAYLVACLIVLYVVPLLLRWLSTLFGLLLRLWPMYLLFNTLPSPDRLFNWFTVGIVVCQGL